MRARSSSRRPAVFLDRDGVLNEDRGFVYRKENFVWMPGAQRAIRRLNSRGYLVVVVTNQSGIARGLYTEEDVAMLHSWMNSDLRRSGARIDAFYVCPHHPTEGVKGLYRRLCECRKPKPGMLHEAMREWPIDREASFVIGDKRTDLQAARSAGLGAALATRRDLDRLVVGILTRRISLRTHEDIRGVRRRAFRGIPQKRFWQIG